MSIIHYYPPSQRNVECRIAVCGVNCGKRGENLFAPDSYSSYSNSPDLYSFLSREVTCLFCQETDEYRNTVLEEEFVK